MAVEVSVPRSRRALLAASLGAAGAALVSAARPFAIRATEGDTVHVGDELTGTSLTRITTTGANAFWGETDAGIGVAGTSSAAIDGIGVYGGADYGQGVSGASTFGVGVYGSSGDLYGVHGWSDAVDEAAILGRSNGDSTGVFGYSGNRDAPAAAPASPAKTGVYGYAVQDAGARGVYGRTAAGQGVRGYATTGTGGYFGTPVSGSTGLHTGTALLADGRVKFPNCVGVTTIDVDSNSVVVTPGIDLTSTSAVVASLMGSAGGTTTVHRCVVNATLNTFTIYLTANNTAAGPVKVAWHIFG